MKTIRSGKEVRRVTDEVAQSLVSSNNKWGWQYCPKSVWKEEQEEKASKKSKK